MDSLFDKPFQAMVVGASGAIGGAFVAALEQTTHCTRVVAVSRMTHPNFDLRIEGSIAELADDLAVQAPFGLIIDATGALTIDGRRPEKSLSAINADQLLANMHINAVAPALLLKHLAPLLQSGPAIYAKLSARVGSISDNRKGGWYGYRAAKAALNMLLQTAAIEIQRKNPAAQIVALQPGTVVSNLSAPFTAGLADVMKASESVNGLMRTLQSLTPKSGAQFLDYKGETIPW